MATKQSKTKTSSNKSKLSQAKPLTRHDKGKLIVYYGQSTSGKTTALEDSPKPMLLLTLGDDGSDSIDVEEYGDGITALDIEEYDELKPVLEELLQQQRAGKMKYKSIAIDTFSLFTNLWIQKNSIDKNKRMSQQMWGDLKTDTEELIRMAHKLSSEALVFLTCHEVSDSFDGLEDEILPEVRPNVTKGARTYLEGMANIGVHFVLMERETTNKKGKTVEETAYVAHGGPNPYYWTKFQKPKSKVLPATVRNFSYAKLEKLMR